MGGSKKESATLMGGGIPANAGHCSQDDAQSSLGLVFSLTHSSTQRVGEDNKIIHTFFS